VRLLNPNFPPATVQSGKLKALILDWAGTTVDYGSLAPVRTLRQVFARADVALTEAEARRDMGLPKKEHIRAILSIERVREEWKRIRGNDPGDTDVAKLYEEFVPLQFSCLLEYSTVIAGVPEAMMRFRRRGLKIGTTTGYTREMLDLLLGASAKAGYVPDCSLCPDDVGVGRPHPYMVYENAVRLQVYPLAAIAKIGDTPADIQEGLNAGTWSIGVAGTGNMNGLSCQDFVTLSTAEQQERLVMARAELEKAGAHYVVDSLGEVDSVLDDIDVRLQLAAESG
jgi:phosphonoacetaldehyde hydrolase